MHLVPAATGCIIACPLLQIPNCVPSAEHNMLVPEQDCPVPVKGTPLEADPAGDVELVPEIGGELGAEGETGEAAADGEAGDAEGAATLAEGEARIVAVTGVTLMPPGAATVEFEEAGAELFVEGEDGAEAPRLTLGSLGQVPFGGASVEPLEDFCTTSPGSGNARS